MAQQIYVREYAEGAEVVVETAGSEPVVRWSMSNEQARSLGTSAAELARKFAKELSSSGGPV